MGILAELPLDRAPEGVIFSAAENPRKLSRFGDWNLVTFLHGVCEEWHVTRDGDRKVLEHPTVATSCIRAGDGSWGDFTLEVEMRQMLGCADTSMDEMFNVNGRTGVMFRYVTYRQNYALFVECLNRVALYRRHEHEWLPLGVREMEIDRGRYYHFRIECRGDSIRCWMDGEPLFDVTDPTYRRGRIAVYANTLSRYSHLRATTDTAGDAEIAGFLSSERRKAAESAEGLPHPVLLKRIPLPPRSGPLVVNVSPDGRLEGAVAVTNDHRFAPRDGVALVSIDTGGQVRWSAPVTKQAHPRIWDLDGDGRQEVICYDGPTIRLIDIDTGETRLEAPTPPCNDAGNRGGRENVNPYLPIYTMFPANVRGAGRGRDVLMFDFYTAFWVLNDKLELEWWRSGEHGHDIGLYDIDGDGCDEVMCGYTMFDHNGDHLWCMDGVEYMIHSHHHVDHVVIGEFDGDPDTGLEIALVSGNAGFFLLDQEGRIRVTHDVGHAQSLQCGQFRTDLPGAQFLVGCRWGNPGTRALFGGNGDRLWTIEPDNSYASDKPVRWASDRDLILMVTTPEAAGFYDGHGRRVMEFADGRLSTYDHPVCVRDFTGNGMDDFVMLAGNELLVYTQCDKEQTEH